MDEGRADEEDVEYLEKHKLANTSSFLTSFFSPAFLSPFFVSLPFLLLFLLLLLQLLSSSVQNFNSCLSFACFLLRGLPFTHFPFLITILILHLYRIISVAPCWTLRGTTVLYLYRVVAFLQVASTLVLFSSGGVELTPPVHGLFSLTST